MSLWRDEKYLRLVSSQLERFKKKSQHEFNFRCPLCGDSSRSLSKARGYAYANKQTLMFKCHNCSVALPFSALLRRLNRALYDEYLLEEYRDSAPAVKDTPSALASSPREAPNVPALASLSQCANALHPCHSVYNYARSRQLPDAAFDRLFASKSAHTWLQTMITDTTKLEKVQDDVPYLILPFRLQDGTWYGCQLRSITEKTFFTFRWSHDPLKLFGMDAWTPTKPTLVLEGVFDSIFLPNALAACGSTLLESIDIAEQQGIVIPHVTYAFDNEPRNKEIVRLMRRAITLGESIVVWPRSFPKDINDAIHEGYSADAIISLIHKRTFQGLMAQLEFEQWKQ